VLWEQDCWIVAGVHAFELACGGVETDEDCGDITSARFDAFFPVLLRKRCGEFIEAQRLAGECAEGRANGGTHEGGSQALACYIGDHNQQRAIGFGKDIEIIAR
jgi:hypothetical protein